ncbi:MAG: hypothetical protein HY606_09045 [Planctomycetes bacterium]|nr:hypothetical protein [Planctomycetota bacterium]
MTFSTTGTVCIRTCYTIITVINETAHPAAITKLTAISPDSGRITVLYIDTGSISKRNA